jgi:phenylacetic acid degradation operon negative regulatory protein
MCNKSDVPEVTPKSLLLDLLRVAPVAVPVRRLLVVGGLFGLEDNAMRVALSRLCQRGLVESDERGSYQLSASASALSSIVDTWRAGDRRLRSWRGDWVAVAHPRGGPRGARERSQRALSRFGFREALPGLWLRPDNLALARDTLLDGLLSIGLVQDVCCFSARDFPSARVDEWVDDLYAPRKHAAHLRAVTRALSDSQRRVRALSQERALVETFVTGGRAIRALSQDPLLPDELVDGEPRRALTAAMTDYDALGRQLWNGFIAQKRLTLAPAHVSTQEMRAST